MSPFVLALLLMVAASLLLSLADVARIVWLRFGPAGAAQLGVGQEHTAAEGFSNDQYARLMFSNAVRTAIFTLIGFLALIAMRRRLMFTESLSA